MALQVKSDRSAVEGTIYPSRGRPEFVGTEEGTIEDWTLTQGFQSILIPGAVLSDQAKKMER